MPKSPKRKTVSVQAQPKTNPSPKPMQGGNRRLVLVGFACVMLIGSGLVFADWWSCLPDDTTARYVGRQSCVQCHTQEVAGWEGSHHDLAMDLATDETVLGDFDDAEIQHFDVTSRMFRKDGKFFVSTEGPDGEMGEFEVKYVLGVEPLQQYMVEFDRTDDMPSDEIARLQVLRLCWDTENSKWFYLPPPDVDEKLEPNDDLHWTRVTMRWNTSCADCHSTNLRKNFDIRTGIYHTTFSEIDVSCEACHGPGSVHVDLANKNSLFWDRKHGYGLAKLKGDDHQRQIDTCAVCHSRRQRSVAPQYQPGENFYDYHSNALLTPLLYHADGQIQDEVYVHGSFIQSKMYHKGIRCTDCHDPHSLQLKHDGNNVCTSCHQHPAGKYDTPAHHRHDVGSTGASCVECHMPETTYMEVDPRRDHSLRVPRPDLSVALGTPNACSRCHLDEGRLSEKKRSELAQYSDWLVAAAQGDEDVQEALDRVNQWCSDKFVEWYGKKDDLESNYAAILTRAREGDPSVLESLIKIARNRNNSAMVRATCVVELGQFDSREALETSVKLLDDAKPLVRTAAIANVQSLPNDRLGHKLTPLLEDPVRLVRTEAARVLARLSPSELRGSDRQLLQAALREYEEGLLVNNDRAATHLSLGLLNTDQRDFDAARQSYETAIRIEPTIVGPRSNLAELLDQEAMELESRAQQYARQGNPAGLQFLERSSKLRSRVAELRSEELELLARDVKLVPDNAAIRYRYGLLLYLHKREEEAEVEIAEACRLDPNVPDFKLALALLYQKQRRFSEAIPYAQEVLELRPDDITYQQLLRDLNQQAAGAGGSGPRSE